MRPFYTYLFHRILYGIGVAGGVGQAGGPGGGGADGGGVREEGGMVDGARLAGA